MNDIDLTLERSGTRTGEALAPESGGVAALDRDLQAAAAPGTKDVSRGAAEDMGTAGKAATEQTARQGPAPISATGGGPPALAPMGAEPSIPPTGAGPPAVAPMESQVLARAGQVGAMEAGWGAAAPGAREQRASLSGRAWPTRAVGSGPDPAQETARARASRASETATTEGLPGQYPPPIEVPESLLRIFDPLPTAAREGATGVADLLPRLAVRAGRRALDRERTPEDGIEPSGRPYSEGAQSAGPVRETVGPGATARGLVPKRRDFGRPPVMPEGGAVTAVVPRPGPAITVAPFGVSAAAVAATQPGGSDPAVSAEPGRGLRVESLLPLPKDASERFVALGRRVEHLSQRLEESLEERTDCLRRASDSRSSTSLARRQGTDAASRGEPHRAGLSGSEAAERLRESVRALGAAAGLNHRIRADRSAFAEAVIAQRRSVAEILASPRAAEGWAGMHGQSRRPKARLVVAEASVDGRS